jgi:hypothetical protein
LHQGVFKMLLLNIQKWPTQHMMVGQERQTKKIPLLSILYLQTPCAVIQTTSLEWFCSCSTHGRLHVFCRTQTNFRCFWCLEIKHVAIVILLNLPVRPPQHQDSEQKTITETIHITVVPPSFLAQRKIHHEHFQR